MNSKRLNLGIVGGSGYTGFELMRLLLQHPNAELKLISSTSKVGMRVDEAHTALKGTTDLVFSAFGEDFFDLDCVFVALPHGESMPVVNELAGKKPKVIDLGADFRLSAPLYQRHYGKPHQYPDLITKAVYGTPELNREEIQSATLVANPGCFAHTTILALAPLALAGILEGEIKVSAITGSTGSGATLSERTHHPMRNDSISAYQVLSHRHIPEIEETLYRASRNHLEPKLEFVPHSGPFSRGIFATCFARVSSGEGEVVRFYEDFARHNHFVRLRAESPRLLDVRGSNFCDLSLHVRGKDVVVLAAIDNLVKGAAGNAVQCLNLMFGLKEESALYGVPLAL